MKIIKLQNVLIKFTLALFVILLVAGCDESYMEKEGKIAVNFFLKDMSPELARKIEKIKEEISLSEEKINKLSEMKLKHPNYTGKIETSRRQWEILQDKLKLSLKEIRDVVESTYVTYELDKIQGGNQFNKISAQLLSAADSVLASAGSTKNAIEQALNEVGSQPLLSLYDVSNSSSDIYKPLERNTFETSEELETVEEPPTEQRALNTTKEPLPSPNISSFCDAKTYLADASLNLMMMVISTEQAEQDALKAGIDEASTDFEKVFAAMLNDENRAEQLASLQETWAKFKNTSKTEIIPAVMAGDNDKALEIANGIQAERMNTMNDIIKAIVVDNCD